MTYLFSRIGLVLAALLLLTVPAAAQSTNDNLDDNCLPPLGLTQGQFVTIIGGVYIRAQPDVDSAIVSYSPERIAARVLGGPVCADGFIWWNVERIFEEPTFKGWVAQGIPSKLFVIPNEPEDLPLPCPPPLVVPLNTAVETFDGIRVRATPSTTGRVLTVAQPETTALVREGPICNEGFNWWRVNVEVLGILYDGWVVEGIPVSATDDPDRLLNDPLLVNPRADAGPNSGPCDPPAPIGPGSVGVLRFDGPPLKNLRGAPSQAAEVLFNLPSGITVEVLSAPFCNEGINWWQVRVRGGSAQPTGWLAEGDWLGRFFGPNGEDFGRDAP